MVPAMSVQLINGKLFQRDWWCWTAQLSVSSTVVSDNRTSPPFIPNMTYNLIKSLKWAISFNLSTLMHTLSSLPHHIIISFSDFTIHILKLYHFYNKTNITWFASRSYDKNYHAITSKYIVLTINVTRKNVLLIIFYSCSVAARCFHKRWYLKENKLASWSDFQLQSTFLL